MRLSKSSDQILVYITCSCLIGLGVNLFRGEPLSILAKSIEIAEPGDELESIFADPMIREIDLTMAQNLHENGKLFVDARAVEYFNEGHIPRAIADDDVDVLASEIESKIGETESFVVYCSDDDCGSSEDLAYELQDLGFMNIFVFKGGWKEWTEANFPVERNE